MLNETNDKLMMNDESSLVSEESNDSVTAGESYSEYYEEKPKKGKQRTKEVKKQGRKGSLEKNLAINKAGIIGA